MSILIPNATIQTQDANRQQLHGDIYIDEGRITDISKKTIKSEAEYSIDASHQLAIPGLINTHTHIPMTLPPTKVCHIIICS